MNLKTPLLLGLLALSPALAAQSAFLTPVGLKQALAHKNFVLINVHVPYEGKIAGTDLILPFDTIGQSRQLPKDKKANIVLYCRSGTMSAEARQTLNGMGYSNVRELQGGFNAWKAAGYPLK
ncbi:rhodanese-like domain-containing protein [Deinococcus radiomollis]|uniref:rhodanese-like domain-containing protein n=1 Tax=Deinococcus radiomollis TaxID=468916 RepID=UPI003891BD59